MSEMVTIPLIGSSFDWLVHFPFFLSMIFICHPVENLLQAHKLRISKDHMVTILLIGSSYDSLVWFPFSINNPKFTKLIFLCNFW
jgi:hypothetical protein